MIYPKFNYSKPTIGICAPSAGVGDRLDHYKEAITVLNNNGFNILETDCVRNSGKRSSDAKIRALELEQIYNNRNVDIVMGAAGGDYMFEIHPYLNMDNFKNNPKWAIGMSDMTNFVYRLTTNLDISSMYGYNADSFNLRKSKAHENAINYLKGNIVTQSSYSKHLSFLDDINNIYNFKKTNYIGEGNFKGRCIGGCLDVIAMLAKTPYDATNNFINKYEKEGIVWYFDVFSLNAYNYYLTLLQLKYLGYFKNCKGVIVGRTALPMESDGEEMTYKEANHLIFGDIPVISEFDIGHTSPTMVFINGAIINVDIKNGKGQINFELV